MLSLYMSNRRPIPTASPIGNDPTMTPTAVPVDALGNSLIPELVGRLPTHNESELIAGETIHLGSTNVSSIFWNWRGPRLFVEFLDGSLYAYEGVSLTTAGEMVATPSPGRFVWNKLRGLYPYRRVRKGTGGRRSPQVVRLVNT